MSHILDDVIWAMGLAVQVALLCALIWRGHLRRLPFFTALIAFYIVRAVYLVTAFGHLDRDFYTESLTVLSLLELVLNMLAAWDLFSIVRDEGPAVSNKRKQAGPSIRQLAFFLGLLILSSGIGYLITTSITTNYRFPLDQSALIMDIMMVLVFLFSIASTRSFSRSPYQKILLGFALTDVVTAGTLIARTFAARSGNPRAYAANSYASIIVYLGVLIFWLVVVSITRSNNPKSVLSLHATSAK